MTETVRWRHMSIAPRDGSRILVTTRSAEQGPSEVDVAYWAGEDQHGLDGWRSGDSHPGQIIGYAETELKCWLPMPGTERGLDRPGAWQGTDEMELDGSGI
jgi:hypothetical protein